MGMRDGQEIVQRHRLVETSDQKTQESVQQHRQRETSHDRVMVKETEK